MKFRQVVGRISVVNLTSGLKILIVEMATRPWTPIITRSTLWRVIHVICLKTSEINGICSAARELLLAQPALLELSAPIEIVGDIHGQYGSLLRIFERAGSPSSRLSIPGSLCKPRRAAAGNLTAAPLLQAQVPRENFLLRGNHDCEPPCRAHGFFHECKQRCGVKVWKAFIDVFNCLSFASTIESKIFYVHSGLSPSLSDLDDIRNIARPTETNWTPNERGVSYCFNANIVHHFLHQHDVDLTCWDNHVVDDGRLLRKSGAAMRVEGDLVCSFQVLKPINTAIRRSILPRINSFTNSAFRLGRDRPP
ncbi:Metallo-dependent phosphatase-like protein [Aspergillus similis]